MYKSINNKLQAILKKKQPIPKAITHVLGTLEIIKTKYSLKTSTTCQKNLLHKF